MTTTEVLLTIAIAIGGFLAKQGWVFLKTVSQNIGEIKDEFTKAVHEIQTDIKVMRNSMETQTAMLSRSESSIKELYEFKGDAVSRLVALESDNKSLRERIHDLYDKIPTLIKGVIETVKDR